MRLFAGSSSDFIQLNLNNQIAELLRKEFLKQFGFNPSQNEVMSWRNSLLRMSILLQQSNLTDNGVFVEYQLPLSSKRIDVVLTGHDTDSKKNAVIIELKQWEKCVLAEYDSDYVVTWVGGGNRNVLHPSVQVGNYKYYIQNNLTAFYDGSNPISLSACSYLHNYNYYSGDAIFDTRFSKAIERFPVFTADDSTKLSEYLVSKLSNGNGIDVLAEIEESRYRPSKKLLKHLSTVIKEKLRGEEIRVFNKSDDYVLLDDQLIVYDNVMSVVKKGLHDKQKHAIIVKGGPGTGKSVVALKLLSDLTEAGRNAHFATGSKSFTETIRKIVGGDATSLFKYFMSYGEVEPNTLDVLIMDEAHRIREKTTYPFKATGRAQIEDLMNAAKVNVFFIDDFQAVRTGEIGSVAYIKEFAEQLNCKVYEYELESQFRCSGSDGYINWINNTLHIQRTANALLTPDDKFEFKIFSSPKELDLAIRQKVNEGFSARLTAGFCWPWSTESEADGDLIKDVQIGEFAMPWNARPEAKKLKRGIPKAQFWAYEPNGIEQIGCIYTAQGFEFDYVGVIFGKDLKFNFETNTWEADPKNSHDSQVKKSKDQFLQLVKNTYRVLLTRGMKGCYVHFMDKETENFFRSRIGNQEL